MKYDIKLNQEVLWAALVAAVAFLPQALDVADPGSVDGWVTVLVAAAIGVARVAIAAGWNALFGFSDQQYEFHLTAETGWAVLTAVSAFVAAEVQVQDGATDWATFLISAGVGSVRVAAATLLNAVSGSLEDTAV